MSLQEQPLPSGQRKDNLNSIYEQTNRSYDGYVVLIQKRLLEMNKWLILVLLFFVNLTTSHAQERILPLMVNSALSKGQSMQTRTPGSNAIDSLVLYEYESLDVQYVWDDFSTDRFPQEVELDEGGITEELFYQLMNEDNTIPLDVDVQLCDSSQARHDTVKIDEGVLIGTETHYPFTPINIWVNDFTAYPVEGEVIEAVFEECYVLIDTLLDGVLDDDQDTIWYTGPGEPTYCQDSARIFTKTVTDTVTLWTDNYAYRNYSFAYKPWSLGVATFDGVDENGWPYDFGNDAAYGVADYLTSRPIDLSDFESGDNVYLTFIYQAEGHGNMPDTFDSLLVEVYDPAEEQWNRVIEWFGLPDEVGPDAWDTARIQIASGYFEDGFRFRFKNYASLSGALDHWHIDYVSIQEDFGGVFSFEDMAISEPLHTILKDYTAVPWDHYKNNTTGNEHMLEEIEYTVYHSIPGPDASAFDFGDWEVRYEDALVGGSPFLIPNTSTPGADFAAEEYNVCTFDGAADYFFDFGLPGVQNAYDLTFSFTSSAGEDRNITKYNDTTRFTQDFRNYYAYDDGSAEAAYGVEGGGSQLAYKFEAYQEGALTGILMHFVPTVTDMSGTVFFLTVWADDDGEPGDIIYQDDYFNAHTPEYAGAQNAFRYYEFNNNEYLPFADSSYLPVGETFYVGWQNIETASLNVGMDANIDNGDKIFRNTSGTWLTSAFEISLMIRPVFSTGLDYTLSEEELLEKNEIISIYPNPAQTIVNINGVDQPFTVSIYDMSGRRVTFVENEHTIDVMDLEQGFYIIDIRDAEGNPIHSTKLVKE